MICPFNQFTLLCLSYHSTVNYVFLFCTNLPPTSCHQVRGYQGGGLGGSPIQRYHKHHFFALVLGTQFSFWERSQRELLLTKPFAFEQAWGRVCRMPPHFFLCANEQGDFFAFVSKKIFGLPSWIFFVELTPIYRSWLWTHVIIFLQRSHKVAVYKTF